MPVLFDIIRKQNEIAIGHFIRTAEKDAARMLCMISIDPKGELLFNGVNGITAQQFVEMLRTVADGLEQQSTRKIILPEA